MIWRDAGEERVPCCLPDARYAWVSALEDQGISRLMGFARSMVAGEVRRGAGPDRPPRVLQDQLLLLSWLVLRRGLKSSIFRSLFLMPPLMLC